MFVGMSSGPGDLLAVYEWTLQCKALRKAESKRIKQVHCTLYNGKIWRVLYLANESFERTCNWRIFHLASQAWLLQH